MSSRRRQKLEAILLDLRPGAGRDEIAIVGRACRLPGAPDVAALWRLLDSGRCAISQIPDDRWPLRRHFHPRIKERGRSYTFAAGVLEDIWGFDPAVFGLTPREAEQMDPQQRLLLELAFEAMEDAGTPPSRLAGSATGVYVGASDTNYATVIAHDPAAGDAYTATGNALSIVANRLSYIFDLRGPSFVVDTACSSSLVALHEAVQALRGGEVERALVAGVNIFASPYAFISFSQAMMLSPTGMCRAFAADADGYVRAEGGVMLVLKSLSRALADGDRIHGVLVGSGVNSDGRTSGISLPSVAGQAALLRKIYSESGVSPDDLCYLEAHGTGTPVGDPVEVAALGEGLGALRTSPLLIGSIKSNIGHTETAAGLAGVLKAMLALENDRAPASLHCGELNPAIDFAAANVRVAVAPVALPRGERRRYAGVSSYGFGGTNAHVVLADPPPPPPPVASAPKFLLLSARGEESLRAMADAYAARLDIAEAPAAQALIASANHRRENMADRLACSAENLPALREGLVNFASSGRVGPGQARALAETGAGGLAFVYAGNGSQWPGMGLSAYRANAGFRAAFDAIDADFRALAGWSLKEKLFSPDLVDCIARASVAQPLVFAIQAALTRALADEGFRPDFVLGHSVGEVAAAEAAGALSLADAVRVIYFRSLHQELTEGAGTMAVLFGPREEAERLAAEVLGVTIGAHNSPGCVAVAGSAEALEGLVKAAAATKLRLRKLDFAYPFHSPLMDPVRAPLLADLAGLRPAEGEIAFISTVTASLLPPRGADADYWWRNVREPVLFQESVEKATELGARYFVEIGPRATLKSHLRDIAESLGAAANVDFALEEAGESADPVRAAALRLLAAGARPVANDQEVLGADPGPGVAAPAYPWRRRPLRVVATTEVTGHFNFRPRHPLIGARDRADALEWREILDAELEPALADHRVGEQIYLPGAAFLEMGLAAARDLLELDSPGLAGFEILQPMILAPNVAREIIVRAAPAVGLIEICSRPRLARTAPALHARCRVIRDPGPPPQLSSPPRAENGTDAEGLYALAEACGLNYGPAYRQAARAAWLAPDLIEVELTAEPGDRRYGVDPARLDSCFHGLNLLFGAGAAPQAFLPVRFGSFRLFHPGAVLSRAVVRLRRRDARALVADFDLFGPAGEHLGQLLGARFQLLRAPLEAQAQDYEKLWLPLAGPLNAPAPSRSLLGAPADAPGGSGAYLLDAWAASAAFAFLREKAGAGPVDLDALVFAGQIPFEHRDFIARLLEGLEAAGLARRDGELFHLATEEPPEAAAILRHIAAQAPERAAELPLAAAAQAGLSAMAAPPEGLVGAYLQRSLAAAAQVRALVGGLEHCLAALAGRRRLRLLHIGCDAAVSPLLALARRHGASLAFLDDDSHALERVRLALAGEGVECFRDPVDLPEGGIDLLTSAGGLTRRADRDLLLKSLARSCAGGALLVAAEPRPSLFRDLVFGLNDAERPAPRSARDWSELCAQAHFRAPEARETECGGEYLYLLTAEAQPRAAAPAGAFVLVHAGAEPDAFTLLLRDALFARGAASSLAASDHAPAAASVWIGSRAPGENLGRLSSRCLALRDYLRGNGGKKRAWLVEFEVESALAEGFFAFSRVCANEAPHLDLRRIMLAAEDAETAGRLADFLLAGGPETDVALRGGLFEALRFAPTRVGGAFAEAARLEKTAEGERVAWKAAARRAPDMGEVEVEVVATGLNFRDVMWALSVLPDEMLENGFAGATLGLEFSGRIVRLGPQTKGWRVGDEVLGFCGQAFSTHLTVAASHIAPLPAGLGLEAAATAPVAFLTAYYGLVSCAQLEKGEWVLIHGGAGGVGLAALQIALARGARPILTAGTPEKRAMLRDFGAEYAFDSRGGGFVDEVMRATGGRGVAVVLNSLAGEAMERSLGLLEPFGRFVELGKRDYLADTPLGLRPFRNNLSYFGVDLDQLLIARPERARRLFAEVMGLFASGALRPLPHTVYAHDEIGEAMRAMQQSAHIGKLVVRPPPPGAIRAGAETDFSCDPSKTHLIVGGLGGFGLATARWLVASGARHLVLLGRSGAASEAARAGVELLRDTGAEVRVEACDATDETAMAALLADLAASSAPLGGVIHAAMHLDDGPVALLDAARLEAVLRPKLVAAEILDRLTRGLKLDYFVLFSSATTLVGNPGQGAYVAANGFLEGLAQARRAKNLPALAVAWGAIADVGVLARQPSLREALAARAGVRAMPSAAALQRLGAALARKNSAFVAPADVNWTVAAAGAPLLRAPAYEFLRGEGGEAQAAGGAHIDLAEMTANLSPEQARRAVARLVVEEIARILRVPREDVPLSRSLAEIGVDSLMGVELALALESRFALSGPVSGVNGGVGVLDVADLLLAGVASGDDLAGDGQR